MSDENELRLPFEIGEKRGETQVPSNEGLTKPPNEEPPKESNTLAGLNHMTDADRKQMENKFFSLYTYHNMTQKEIQEEMHILPSTYKTLYNALKDRIDAHHARLSNAFTKEEIVKIQSIRSKIVARADELLEVLLDGAFNESLSQAERRKNVDSLFDKIGLTAQMGNELVSKETGKSQEYVDPEVLQNLVIALQVQVERKGDPTPPPFESALEKERRRRLEMGAPPMLEADATVEE